MIWQLFNAVEKGFAASGETDQAFLQGALVLLLGVIRRCLMLSTEVLAKRAQMDKGLHIGSWGQLQGQIYNLVVG